MFHPIPFPQSWQVCLFGVSLAGTTFRAIVAHAATERDALRAFRTATADVPAHVFKVRVQLTRDGRLLAERSVRA